MKHIFLYIFCLLLVIGCRNGRTKDVAAVIENDTVAVAISENDLSEMEGQVNLTTVILGKDTLVLENTIHWGSSPLPTTLHRKTGGESAVTELPFALRHIEGNRFVILQDDFACLWEPELDAFTGHCYYEYPVWYENGEFHEYKTRDISKAEFLQMEGAKELLDSLSSEGWKVTEIFSRQDGHTFLNLRKDLENGIFCQSFVDFPENKEPQEGVYKRSVL